jgi:hypothetical protein
MTLYQDNGKISAAIWEKNKFKPSRKTIAKLFGSWNDALVTSGIPLNNQKKKDFKLKKALKKK